MIDKLEEFFLNILIKLKLKKIVDIYLEHKAGMRYLIFGALSTIVNILIFAFCYDFIKFSTTISNIIAWIIAVIFAYITNKLWVFYSKTTEIKKLIQEILSFFGARVLTLVIETIFLNIFIDKLGFNSIFMKIISNIIVIILNYIFSKWFIFKRNR